MISFESSRLGDDGSIAEAFELPTRVVCGTGNVVDGREGEMAERAMFTLLYIVTGVRE